MKVTFAWRPRDVGFDSFKRPMFLSLLMLKKPSFAASKRDSRFLLRLVFVCD